MASRLPEHLQYARLFLEDPEGFRDLVEGLPVVTYVDPHDEDDYGIYVSPQIEEILGYAPIEWIADPHLRYRLMHTEDRERVEAESAQSDATGEPFLSEYRMHGRDGREVWIRDEAVFVAAHGSYPAFWMGAMLDITELKRTESKLKRSLDALGRASDERQMLLTRLEDVRETERKEIAADIHDDSIQVMAAASLRLQLLLTKVPEQFQSELNDLTATVNEAIDRLRQLVFELRPVSLDTDGLSAALKEYLGGMGPEAGFSSRVHDQLQEEPSAETRTAIYRLAQETINNIRKHARARHVEVFITPDGDGVRLKISDDGVGFEVHEKSKAIPGHLGIAAMRERVDLLGGELAIESSPGAGTLVEFWIPSDIHPEPRPTYGTET